MEARGPLSDPARSLDDMEDIESMDPRPSFLYIGPDKAGSTWLYELLRAHPRCFVPPAKDLYFFDRFYGRGRDWYLSFFRDLEAGIDIVGEISHDYLFSPVAAQRIHDMLPRVQLLTFLRDPIERAFSQFLYLRRSGQTTSTLPQAIDEFPRIVGNSLYTQHLSRYLAIFPREQLGCFLFEHLKEDEERFASDLLRFLGGDLSDLRSLPGRTLPAGRARSTALARSAKWGAELVRGLGFPNFVGRIKRSTVIQAVLYSSFQNKTDRPTLREQDAKLLARKLDSDILQLPDLLGWPEVPQEWETSRSHLR